MRTRNFGVRPINWRADGNEERDSVNSCNDFESACPVKACDTKNETVGCGECGDAGKSGDPCWNDLDLECSVRSSRGCLAPTRCDNPWMADGSSKQLGAVTKVCCSVAACPRLSTSCPSYVRTVDQNGCVTKCSCTEAVTMPMRTNGPTRGPTVAPTTGTIRSTIASSVATTQDPDSLTGKFDSGIWDAIIVVLVLFMLLGFAISRKRSNARNGGYDLNMTVGGIPAHGAPQFKESRRQMYNLDAPETSGPQGAGPQPAVAETAIDAHRTFAQRGNGVLGTREERASLSAAANDPSDLGGEYLEVMGGLTDHSFATGTGGGGGGGGAADPVSFGWQLGGEGGARAEGKTIPPRLPPAKNPALDSWTPGYYHNPDASEA